MIPDNEDRDDNKMYFFFTEKALEAENNAHTIYTRVGRLCVVRMAGLCHYSCLCHSVYQARCNVFHLFLLDILEFHTAGFDHIHLPSVNSSIIHISPLPVRHCVLQQTSTLIFCSSLLAFLTWYLLNQASCVMSITSLLMKVSL